MGAMESLTESGVLWSLLLEQDSQPLQQHLEKLTEGPAGAEFCCRPGSEEIPAVSACPWLLCALGAPGLTILGPKFFGCLK